MNINFKYEVGQKVIYHNRRYTVLARAYFEHRKGASIRYNLKGPGRNGKMEIRPEVLEYKIRLLEVIK